MNGWISVPSDPLGWSRGVQNIFRTLAVSSLLFGASVIPPNAQENSDVTEPAPSQSEEVPLETAPPLSVTLPSGMVITAFGVVDVGLSYANNVSNGARTGPGRSILQLENGILTVSKLGLKGDQPLDFLPYRTHLLFDIEPGFDVVNQDLSYRKSFFSRNAWVGLTGDWGTLSGGRQWNFNDDFLIGSYTTGGYRLSVFRLNEFGELSDIHDNTIKYVTPLWHGVQAGFYHQFYGDNGIQQNEIYEGFARFQIDKFNAVFIYDRHLDGRGNVISSMPSFGLNYTLGNVKLRTSFAFNSLSPSLSQYPGGAGYITIPFKEQVNLYACGFDWQITRRLVLSGDFAYRDNTTLHNNTQLYRLLADYIINPYFDVYSQIGYIINGGGAAESFYSDGPTDFSGTGYRNQGQFAFINGFRFKF